MSPARLRNGALGLVVLAVAWVGGGTAQAAGPPEVRATWASSVTAASAVFHAEVNPAGLKTHYHFAYIDDAEYRANVDANPPRDGFSGAAQVPVSVDGNIPASVTFEEVVQHVGGLAPETVYHYRIVAGSSAGTTLGPARELATQSAVTTFTLPDARGWEMVSPPDKNGGDIQGFGGTVGGGVLQAAAQGGAITYSSTSSFGEASGGFGASQYIGRRQSSGWSTENITLPMVSGGFGTAGVPYQLFSPELGAGLAINGRHCRSAGEECPVPNPPLPGTDAPAGYLDYYLRDNVTGGFEALLGESTLLDQPVSPGHFDVSFVGATPDLGHVVLSTCAALTANSVEVASGEDSCDAAETNLYEWSPSGLRLINVEPGESVGTPGARLAAQAGAVSEDGSRVYWMDREGALMLREGEARTVLVDSEGIFQAASADGSFAFFSKGEHLYRYDAASESSVDLTPAGGLKGVLGASADGSYVYYLTNSGLYLWHGGSTVAVAPGAAAGSFPPATGTARVSADGKELLFMSADSLTSYENLGEMEVYLYEAAEATITCVSCNPTGERPEGPASIPGAVANGEGPDATDVYKPRVLSSDGDRVFFDSRDALIPQDTNHEVDVYEWEAHGVGGCSRASGCIGPISSGRGSDGATFVDASADGSDAFFLTDESLVSEDLGGIDIYDARAGGGFPEPPPPIPCVGDACQPLPPEPEDPTPGTGFLTGETNPPVSIPKQHHKGHHKKRHRGKARGSVKARGGH